MARGIGGWAFLIGVLLAVIFGFIPEGAIGGAAILQWILVILGLIIGLLNIAEKEVQPFLLAGAVLVIVSAMGGNVFTGYLSTILKNLLTLFVPATIIVALKSVFGMAKA